MRQTRRFLYLALPAALLVTVAVAAAGVAFVAAHRSLTRSADVARGAHGIAFTSRELRPEAAQSENPGFEPLAAASGFTSGALLDGTFYLSGPGGLSAFGADGAPLYTLRTGSELPVSPVVAVAAGRVRGAASDWILLATSGAGMLVLKPVARGLPAITQVLPEPVGSRDLTALLPLASGDVLLGTRGAGVLLFDGTTLAPLKENLPGGSAALQVTALAAADAGTFLIGTRDAGVFLVHGGTVSHADAGSGLPDDQVDALATDGAKAYVGTPQGVAEFDLGGVDGAAFRPARTLAPGTFGHALALLAGTAGQGQLLVGTLDQGVREIELAAGPRTRPTLHQASFAIDPGLGGETTGAGRVDRLISPAGSGTPAYALAGGRLMVRSRSGWAEALPTAGSTGLSDRNVSALAFAPDGRLYVGYFDHGLDILDAAAAEPRGVGAFGRVRHFEDDHLFCVNRLAPDPRRGTMTAATANGLVLFDRQDTARQVLTRRDGLISDHVSDVVFTRSGMTVATPAGITSIGLAGAESLYAFQGLVNNHVYALGAAAGTDRMLAGTLGGISVLDGGTVRRNLTVANSGLKHNWITALAQTADGGWLIGTYGAGVMTLSADGDHFQSTEMPAEAPRDLVINPNALLVTKEFLFAGTLGHGMLMFDLASGRWTAITAGLPSLNVTAFAERDGVLYVGTENGLVRIAVDRLRALAAGGGR